MDLENGLEVTSPGCRGGWDIGGSEGHGMSKKLPKFVFL